jgi:hypothetical protein
MYDIFYISSKNNLLTLPSLRKRFPFAKVAANVLEAKEKSLTKMFWVVWEDLLVLDDFDFEFTIPSWDEKYVHVFKNSLGGMGVCLISKEADISKRESDFCFFVNKKEIDTVTSTFRKYDRFYISSYEQYLEALDESTTELFWCVWNELTVTDETIFDLVFDPLDNRYDFDRNINHVFKNKDIEEEKFNGIMLMSKNKKVPRREIEFRFLVDKKEHDKLVSKLTPYDIVFISYDESNADKNYQTLLNKKLENNIYRIHGVKGIHQAHLEAAKIVKTPMFWVTDGDAVIDQDFNFDHLVPRYDRYIVHVWYSKNPINKLEYGYGGIKLLPKKQTLEMSLDSADMTSSISTGFRIMETVSNITEFNTDPFNTWKSAFRECVKLSSKIILGQIDQETENRLSVWCTEGIEEKFGEYAIAGALAGKSYGEKNAGNTPALNLINDFDWLKSQFESSVDTIGNTFDITSAHALATS